MDETKFSETEQKYRELKEMHAKGAISADQLKAELKRLMVQDDSGTYWMLGGKSGKWYRHDGTQWQEADPYEMFAEEEEALLELDESVKISSDEDIFPSEEESSPASPDAFSYAPQEAGAREEVDKTGDAIEGQYLQDNQDNQPFADEARDAATAAMEEPAYNAFDTFGTYEIDTTTMEESSEAAEEEISFAGKPMAGEVREAKDEETGDLLEDSAGAVEVEEDAKKYEYTVHKGETPASTAPVAPTAPIVPTAPTAPAAAGPFPGASEAAAESPEFITCGICKSRIPPYAVYCAFCGAHQKSLKQRASIKSVKEEGELLIKAIKLTSFLFFLGGLGLIIGVIGGAIFGVVKDFLPGLSPLLSMMLSEVRGGWAGGLIFAAIGGIGGFVFSAILAVILSGVYNFIAFIFGGVRFKIKR
jgi:hypothetical protein